MPFDILGYRDKYKSFYGDAPLEEVAQSVYKRTFAKEYPDYDTWKKDAGIETHIQEDIKRRTPPTFMDKLRNVVAPEGSILAEIPRGLEAGVQQIKGFGYGLEALAGEAIGSDTLKKRGAEGLADVEKSTPKPQVPSFTDIKSGSDLAKYLAYGITTNIPNMALSMAGGGVGGFLGKKAVAAAAESAVSKTVASKILQEGITKGAVTGAGAASIGMEAGSIAGDQLTETGQVDPLRAIAGAIPAGLLDVLPEYKLAKKLGWLGKDAAEFAGNRFVQALKAGAQQFMWEAPTEAMQSVIERGSVPGKSITDQEAKEEYINSFILGGLTGAVVGGGSHAVTGLAKGKPAPEENPVMTRLQNIASLNGIIFTGMKEGSVADHPFTPNDAVEIIRKGHAAGLYTDGHIDWFKNQYPQLRDGLNGIIADSVMEKVKQTIQEETDVPLSVGTPLGPSPEELAFRNQYVGIESNRVRTSGKEPDTRALWEEAGRKWEDKNQAPGLAETAKPGEEPQPLTTGETFKTPDQPPTEIKAAGTGGKRGPKEKITPSPVVPDVKEETPTGTSLQGEDFVNTKEEFKAIHDAYSGDKVGEGKIRTPFTYKGQLRTTLGVYGDTEAQTYRLFPLEEYKGQTYSQEEIYAMYGEGTRERGDDTGLLVSHKGKKYVLTDPLKIKVKPETPTPEGDQEDLVGKISRGEISDGFTFPEHFSPQNINDLWDDLFTAQEDIDAKNKPRIDELVQEQMKLKGDRSATAKERKKAITEEMDRLQSESNYVGMHAQRAFESAQEKVGQIAAERLKKEGIEVSETDQDNIYEMVSVLSDGRMNEKGWSKPILQQIMEEFKASKKKEPWQITRAEWLSQKPDERLRKEFGAKKDAPWLGYHSESVRQAVKRGETVPPEVLADYPDLKLGEETPSPDTIVEPGATSEETTETRGGKGVATIAKAKEAWEMTQKEYRDQDAAVVSAQQYIDAANRALGTGKVEHAGARLKRAEAAQRRWSKAFDRAVKMHGEAVRQAITEGKSVPPSVLADYPDLQPRETADIKAAGTGGKRGPKQKPVEKPTAADKNAVEEPTAEPQKAEEPKTEEQGFPEKWDAMGYGERQDIAQASTYGNMRKVVHRISGSKWSELSSGEQEEIRKTAAKSQEETTVEEPKADIMTEIKALSDEDLDALLDMPETKATPAKTTNEAIKKVFSTARDRQKGRIPSAAATKNLDEILSAVAKEGITGAEEALKGLYELFGGPALKSFPGGFDEDTYAKAKPHFEAALQHFIEVGKGLHEFAATIIQQFGDSIRPYLKRFITEQRDGVTETAKDEASEDEVINLDENTGKGEGGARTRRKLTEQEKADKEARAKAAAEKKAKKAAMGEFKNVGYVYDPEKLNQRIKDKPPKSAGKIILDEMLPAKLWGTDFAEGTTPGTVRLKDQIQKQFNTFKEYLISSRDRLKWTSGKTIEARLERWIHDGGSIDTLKDWAQEYGKAMQPIIDAFNGQTSITGVIGKLQETVLTGIPKEGGAYPENLNHIKSEDRSIFLRDYNYVSNQHSLYRFITESWKQLLADENDVLLSEININKRGRNQTVVRVGLPDYREGVELKKTEDFQDPFGFKGVGFGEEGWINQEERNRVIPAAYDAFKDLAATIGAPDKGMSLGGSLAVQFANLGHKAKGAAAAYFPTVQTINFTRDNGDGTMAHEWGHGLHDLADGGAIEEINNIIRTFYHIYDFDAGDRLANDLMAKDSPFLKRMVSNKKQNRIEAIKNEIKERFEYEVRKETDYYATAKQMDADYTARAQEMWARAFEAYVFDTLKGTNNYLVNDFVAAGRVGGKSGVGTKLVYPSGKERETFNTTIKYFLDGLVWDENGKPALKEDYVTIEKFNEMMLQLRLKVLLDQVEARYSAIWTSEPSSDGFFWYRYDETSFGPMMQPDGYAGYDKNFTSEEQNGTGAVCYLTQLHPDVILDYKLSNIQYEGENPTYISKEGGGINDALQEDGTDALDDIPSGPDRGAEEGGDVREGDGGSSTAGVGGARGPGSQRDTDASGQGDGAEGVHPSPAGNYLITDSTLNDPKSIDVRFGLNLSAVKVLNLIESENRLPKGDEKDILAKYSGWGGMSELFSWSPSEKWAGKSELVKAELTDEEIQAAESSSTSAYYTPVPVGQFMWKLAQRLGYKGGVVLDPATGANGLFLGTMPADLAQGTTLQAIEMDSLSARIAKQLYGLASIENKALQDVNKPNNRFDLTITNVPFENMAPTDLKHNKGGHKLHNYFINKMLNLTAPGALSMMITTSKTLDSVGSHLTEYAGKAQLVGAIRLPSGIYGATNVATDILVFRKNIEGSKFAGIPVEEWTTTGEDESTGLTINNYFLKHPEMVAGKLEKITGKYGDESLRVAPEGDLQTNLERIASAFPGNIVEREAVKDVKSIDDLISAPGTVKEGGLYHNDKGEVCWKIEGEEIKLPTATAREKKTAAIAGAYVHVLDQVRSTLRAQKTETDDAVVKAEQAKLKKYYDTFVKKYGPVNDPKNSAIYNDATDSAWVLALEEYDPDTGKVTKVSDIFTKNITGVASRPDRADTDHDALAMALDEFGYPNLEYMARLRGSDVESVMAGVADKIIENPETGFLETMDEYLSGNVKRKLAVARDMAASNPEYARNVSLLEAAQPPEIPSHRITARIGASWILPQHLTDFVKEKMGLGSQLSAVFNFNPVSNDWSMSFKGEEKYRGHSKGYGENKAEIQRRIASAKRSIEARTTWGTERMDFFELIECALNGKRPQVTYYVDKKQYLDEVATKAAEVKLQDIQAELGRWLFDDPARAEEAVKRFNDIINTSIPMKADGSHLTFPGKSMWMLTPKEKEALGVTDAMTFYPHQMNAVWKYLRAGNIYLAHEVGAGKTVTMGLIAMEAKRLRGKKKVLYVTLNDSTMGQAVAEIKNLYPMANVLPVRVSTNEQRKQRALQKMALNDFDVAIMRQQDLDRIDLSPESELVFIEEELVELREVLEEAKRNGARILEQDIQVRIHALEEKLKAPGVHAEAKRKNLFFDDLGIDLLVVDEAHAYKNVPYVTRLTRITGLNPAGSPTAKTFFRKTQYLNAQFPKHDAIVLASGTSLSNSIAELYNIQRMLQPQEVKRQGVWSFDRWIANHGDMGSQMEFDGARGQYKVITTNRKIVNAGRLLATVYQNVDSVRAKDTPIKRPIIRGGEPQRVKIKPNQYVEDYKKIILDRCAAIEMDPKNATFEGVPDNMLRVISNMSKVAIDQRLDHHYANTEMQQDSKIAVVSQNIFKRWKEEAKNKGVQLVFADMGIPKKYSDKFKYKTGEEIEKLTPEALEIYNEEKFEHEAASTGFNTYEGLKKELVRLGIPENQIAFIHDADHTNKEKKATNLRTLFKKVNAGEIRVLVGSTSKAGTGVNIQQRVSDIHHLDIWWNYSAWEQRNGRGIRAGNIYANEGMPGTYIWNYVTETTGDATRWDKVFAKGKVLNAVLGGDINIDVIEDISEETMSAKMMAAEASGNPLMATQANLLQQVQGLRFEQAAHLDVVRRSKMELAAMPGRIETLEKNIADYQRSRDVMDKVTAVQFVGDNRTLVMEKHGKEIAEALQKTVESDTSSWKPDKKKTLLVFGSHTETSVTEKVDGKDKKVKKFAFSPLAVTASMTGQVGDPFGRRLLISGNVLSSDRVMAGIKIEKGKKPVVDVKANVSRTVTEYLSYLNSSETSAVESIAELQKNEPKLRQVIDSTWVKAAEFEKKSKELRDVEAQISSQGGTVGNPETGIPIAQYKGVVPMLEDIADKDSWRMYEGVVFPPNNPVIGINKPMDLSKFLRTGKVKMGIASRYDVPEFVKTIMAGGKPDNPATRPIAYTVIDNATRFWVPADAGYVTVDPTQWNLLRRIIGADGSWHYVNRGIGEKFLVHVDETGKRDAFITAQEERAPKGVIDLGEKAQPSTTLDQTPMSTLADVQSIFKGQEVIQPGGENSPIYIKTQGGQYLTIERVNQISPDEVDFQYSYGREIGADETITGGYLNGNIRLVRDAAGKWTLAHESAHYMEDFGILNASDVAILRDHIRRAVHFGKMETANKKDIGGSEDRANFIADALTREKPFEGAVGKIISRIREFLDRLFEAFGIKARTAESVVRDIESGRVFEGGEGRDVLKGGEQYSVRKQSDPPVSKDPKTLNLYLKDETDAIVQTILSKLHPDSMSWLETMLKSPEWFDHPKIKNIVKLFMRDRSEIYHETFNDLNAADNPFQEYDTVSEAAKALKNKGLTLAERISGKISKEYAHLQKILDEGDTTWKRDTGKPLDEQIKAYEDHIRKKGATEDIIAVWRLFRQSFDKALDLQTQQLRDMIEQITEEANFLGQEPDLDQLKQTLKGALAQMETWKGFYAPRIREQGDWKVQAFKAHGPMPANKEFYREHAGSELAARRIANRLHREGWTISNVGKVEKLPEEVYQDVNAVATAKLIDAALDKVSASGNQATKFNEDILRAVADEIRARGFRSHMIHRAEGAVIKGYIEDPLKRLLLYNNQISGGISKARVARMAMEELLGTKVMGKQVGGIDPIKDPKAYTTATNYIREQLRNMDSSDRMIGLAKSIATFKFLGFNLRSLAVNMTAVMTTAPAAIHQYAMGGKGSMIGILRELGVAGKDYGSWMAGKRLLNADEQRAMEEAKKKGWADEQYAREAMGDLSKIHSKAWSTLMDGSMYLFGMSERWNRGTTILAAYRIARKMGLGHAEAMERAKEASDKAHGVYGRSTMPMWAQGANPAAKIGQMMYVYSKFGHNYLQMLYDMGLRKHNIKGAMFAILSPLVLAGGAALPFKDAIFGFAGVILKALFGDDRDPEKWVWDTIREHLGKGAEKVGRHGLTGSMGMDISSSLSIGVGIPKNFIDLTGAIGGAVTEGQEAFDALMEGRAGKAVEHLLPSGFANPLRAIRERREGVATRNNRRVWDEGGRPFVPSGGETAARAFGFRSTKQAVLSERTWEGHRQQAEFANRRDAIYERYRAWILGGRDRGEYNKIVIEIRKYNAQITEHGIKGVSRITSESLKNQVKRMRKPSKSEMALLAD